MAYVTTISCKRIANPTSGGIDKFSMSIDFEYEMRKGILNWYPFEKGTKCLYIGSAGDAVCNLIIENEVDCIIASAAEVLSELFQNKYKGTFDYVVAINKLETAVRPRLLLEKIRTLMSKSGKLLFSVENRLGLKYVCGDKDPYTGNSFDGIEYYRSITDTQRQKMVGRCYSKAEIIEYITQAGFSEI